MGRESIETKDVWTRCLIETDYFIGYQIYVIFKSCYGGTLHGDIAPRSYKFLTENSNSRCEITPCELFDEDASDFKTNRSYCRCSWLPIHTLWRQGTGNSCRSWDGCLPLMVMVHSAERCYQPVWGGGGGSSSILFSCDCCVRQYWPARQDMERQY